MSDRKKYGENGTRSSSKIFGVLERTRRSFTSRLSSLFSTQINEEEIEDLHDSLILSDIGVEVSEELIKTIRTQAKRSTISGEELVHILHRELAGVLKNAEWDFDLSRYPTPTVILMVGVNGVGKTTTSAKIAHYLKQNGQSVMLAACDTFRPAAIEQLQAWGQRLDLPVISQKAGADPAAVAHDAYHSAVANRTSVLIVDTGGRQQTRDDLMRQLGKIRRVLNKIENSAPHVTLITIDAGTGQNALSQVEQFNRHTPLSGVCVTKLDGTAKGGITVALTQKHSIPICFIGVGEKIEDLAVFRADEYASSLLGMKR